MAELSVSGRIKRGGFRLEVAPLTFSGEGVTALFGPSGAGKSTLLAALAGLVPAPLLEVRHGDERWQGVPPHRRGIGMVRQDAFLFPHLSVAENLRFPLRFTRHRCFAFEQVVETLGLGEWLERRPCELSGGQRQRVALGQALLRQPVWLFLDEPLSALDDRARQQALALLERVKREFSVPMLLVTHRVDEVEALADAVAFVESGEVTPPVALNDLVRSADSRLFAVSEPVSLLTGVVANPCNGDGLGEVVVAGETFLTHPVALPAGAPCRLRVPASQVMLAQEAVDGVSALNRLHLQVLSVSERGHQLMVSLALTDGQVLLATVTRASGRMLELAPGRSIWALIKAVGIL